MGVRVIKGKCRGCGSVRLLSRCCPTRPKMFVCRSCAFAHHPEQHQYAPEDLAIAFREVDAEAESIWKMDWHIERGWN